MDQFGYYNPNYLYANVPNSRVYINPNFNKIGSHENSVPVVSNSNIVYFNPNFSNNTSSQHNAAKLSSDDARPRIHVNPNFIKPKIQNQIVTSSSSHTMAINTLPSTSRSFNCNQRDQEPQNNIQINIPSPVTNSRYCLVRKKDNKALKTLTTKVTTNTIKINKYKSISLNSVKNDLASDKLLPVNKRTDTACHENKILKSKSKYKMTIKPKSYDLQNSRFKFVKRNSASILNVSETKPNNVIYRASLPMNKTILKTSLRQTKKIVKGSLKKNNIPCSLYKKYGKCLRMLRGRCEFLHDKKHVSICRKFMKGICHDEQCLLSHDLTDKKMPTCYFYLQGMCTKETCPYLHVKLNEKTKTCQDFLKGYCERGDKCLYRHVNVTSAGIKVTKESTKKHNLNTQISKRASTERAKSRRKTIENKKVNINQVQNLIKHKNGEDDNKEQRYFKDLASDPNPDEQNYSLIKPTRCKLGTLPSFIQL